MISLITPVSDPVKNVPADNLLTAGISLLILAFLALLFCGGLAQFFRRRSQRHQREK